MKIQLLLRKGSLSTNTDSSVSSSSTGSVATDEEEDTSPTGVARFKKATSSVKSMKRFLRSLQDVIQTTIKLVHRKKMVI